MDCLGCGEELKKGHVCIDLNSLPTGVDSIRAKKKKRSSEFKGLYQHSRSKDYQEATKKYNESFRTKLWRSKKWNSE